MEQAGPSEASRRCSALQGGGRRPFASSPPPRAVALTPQRELFKGRRAGTASGAGAPTCKWSGSPGAEPGHRNSRVARPGLGMDTCLGKDRP